MAVATRTVNANASSGTQTGRPCPASPYGYLLLQPTFVVQMGMSIASLKPSPGSPRSVVQRLPSVAAGSRVHGA